MQHDPYHRNGLTARIFDNENNRDTQASSNHPDTSGYPNPNTMTLIPWKDIWSSLKMAKIRGNGEMIEVFYDTLFKEAIFDDKGAWSWESNKRIPNS